VRAGDRKNIFAYSGKDESSAALIQDYVAGIMMDEVALQRGLRRAGVREVFRNRQQILVQLQSRRRITVLYGMDKKVRRQKALYFIYDERQSALPRG
jgi:tRNA(Phe) wybutosine-synthesizing methylase Tyw3